MISGQLTHLLPANKRYIVYYTDGYGIVAKEFNALEYTHPFVDKLVNQYGMFQFVELREIIERKIK